MTNLSTNSGAGSGEPMLKIWRLLIGIILVCSTVFFMLDMEDGVGWKDSPEYEVAAATLGIPHPPGAPLLPVFCRAVSVLTGLGAANGCNFFSVLSAVGTSLIIVIMVLLLLPDKARFPEKTAAVFAAWVVFTGSPGVVEYSSVGETYLPFAFLLSLFILFHVFIFQGKEKWKRTLYLLSWYVAGLSICLHLTGVVLFFPLVAEYPFFFHGWRDCNRTGFYRFSALVTGMFFLGLSPNIYLPIRAGKSFLLDWGSPGNLERLVAFLTVREFATDLFSLGFTAGGFHGLFPGMPFAGLGVASVVMVLSMGFLGLTILVVDRSKNNRRVAVILSYLFASFTAYAGFFGGGIDLTGYMVPGALILSVLSGLGVAHIVRWSMKWSGIEYDITRKESVPLRHAAGILPLFVVVLILFSFFTRLHKGTAEYYSDRLMDCLPDSGRILFITDDTVDYFLLLHGLMTRPENADRVIPVYSQQLGFSWAREKLVDRVPGLNPFPPTGKGTIAERFLSELVETAENDGIRIFYTAGDRFLFPPSHLRSAGIPFELLSVENSVNAENLVNEDKSKREISGSVGTDPDDSNSEYPDFPLIKEKHYRERIGLVFADHGQVAFASGHSEKALEMFEKASEMLPSSEEIVINRAVVLRKTGRIDKAVSLLNGFMASNGKSYRLLCVTGRLLSEKKDWNDAGVTFVKALDMNRGREALTGLATCLLHDGDPSGAIKLANEVLAAHPDDPAATVIRGECFLTMNLSGKAEREFESVIERNPGFERAWMDLALLYMNEGMWRKAGFLLDEALDAVPGSVRLKALRQECSRRMGK